MTRRRHSQRGNALIEFALTFTVLFPLFYGTFEFGYAFYVYNQLVNAARSGARYASLETYSSSTSDPTAGFTGAVQNVVVYGQTTAQTKPLVPGLTAANVVVSAGFVNQVPATVTVAISGYPLNAVFRTFILNSPSVTFPYTGRYAP